MTDKLHSLDDDSIMTFGKHKGATLGNVPSHYLLWWWDEADGYKKTTDPLHYYVKTGLLELCKDFPKHILLHRP